MLLDPAPAADVGRLTAGGGRHDDAPHAGRDASSWPAASSSRSVSPASRPPGRARRPWPRAISRSRSTTRTTSSASSPCRPACRSRIVLKQRGPDRPRMDRRRRGAPRTPPDGHRAGPRLAPDRGHDPGRLDARDDGHVRHARHVPVHLPPARARGVRDGRDRGGDRPLTRRSCRAAGMLAVDATAPGTLRCDRGRPAGGDRAGRAGPPRQPAADQGPRLRPGRARCLPAARPPARPRADDRGADRARARAPPPQGRRARALHRPGRAAGPQRDAVLPAPRPSTSRSSCRSSTRRRSGGPARSSATSSGGRAASGSRRRTATGSRRCSARGRTRTSG